MSRTIFSAFCVGSGAASIDRRPLYTKPFVTTLRRIRLPAPSHKRRHGASMLSPHQLGGDRERHRDGKFAGETGQETQVDQCSGFAPVGSPKKLVPTTPISVLRLRDSDQAGSLEVNFVFELPADRLARRRGAHTEQNTGVPFEATGPDV